MSDNTDKVREAGQALARWMRADPSPESAGVFIHQMGRGPLLEAWDAAIADLEVHPPMKELVDAGNAMNSRADSVWYSFKSPETKPDQMIRAFEYLASAQQGWAKANGRTWTTNENAVRERAEARDREEYERLVLKFQNTAPAPKEVDEQAEQIMDVLDNYFGDARFDIPWDILHKGEGKDILRTRLKNHLAR